MDGWSVPFFTPPVGWEPDKPMGDRGEAMFGLGFLVGSLGMIWRGVVRGDDEVLCGAYAVLKGRRMELLAF